MIDRKKQLCGNCRFYCRDVDPSNRFYFDELYEATVIRAHDFLAATADWIDRWVISGFAVRGLHGTTEIVGRLLR